MCVMPNIYPENSTNFIIWSHFTYVCDAKLLDYSKRATNYKKVESQCPRF